MPGATSWRKAASINPYRYAGYRYDDEIGLYYLIHRYYNPRNGNFISKDPDTGDLDDLLSQNGYTYANNNPMANIDPDGSRGFRFGGGNRFSAPRLRIPRVYVPRIRALRSSGVRLNVSASSGGARSRRGRSDGSRSSPAPTPKGSNSVRGKASSKKTARPSWIKEARKEVFDRHGRICNYCKKIVRQA